MQISVVAMTLESLCLKLMLSAHDLLQFGIPAGGCDHHSKEKYNGKGWWNSFYNIGYFDIIIRNYSSYWLHLHFHIDKWCLKGNETESRTNKSFGCKKTSRGIKQLQKPVLSKYEVNIHPTEKSSYIFIYYCISFLLLRERMNFWKICATRWEIVKLQTCIIEMAALHF